MMNDVLRSRWKHFKNEINHHWTELSTEDLDRINERRDLVLLLEDKYGYARRRAEQEVEGVVTEFENMLRRAS